MDGLAASSSIGQITVDRLVPQSHAILLSRGFTPDSPSAKMHVQ
jgi:hypothetical protein